MNIVEVEILESYADNQHNNWPGVQWSAEIDAPIAEKPCDVCGNKREFKQIVNNNNHREFSICRTCDDVIEI